MPNSTSPTSSGPTLELSTSMQQSGTMPGATDDSARLKKAREVRNRLILGPCLIAFVMSVFALDEWLAGQPLPEWLHWTGRVVWSPGAAILPVVIAIALLA